MNSRVKTLLIGAIAGALLGTAFAWVASDSDTDDPEAKIGLTQMRPTDYFQLGVSLLNVARQFSDMVKKV